MAEQLTIRGTLVGHAGWVTSIATPLDPNSDTVLTSSRHALGQQNASLAHTRALPHRFCLLQKQRSRNNTLP